MKYKKRKHQIHGIILSPNERKKPDEIQQIAIHVISTVKNMKSPDILIVGCSI